MTRPRRAGSNGRGSSRSQGRFAGRLATSPVVAVGVDGYAKGWVAVALDQAGTFVRAWPAVSLDGLLAEVTPGTPVGIDMPLGGVDEGWRTADLSAKAMLGRRGSTIFLVPPRPLWELTSYPEANAELRRRMNKGLSWQAHGLFRKMLEAERARDTHELFEVHPELAFAEMAGEAVPPKQSWDGLARRRSLLTEVGVVLPDHLGSAGAVPPDDVLDAAAVAWCAYRLARGGARHVPDPPDQYDGQGRPIVIWF